jgi:signal peptidase I
LSVSTNPFTARKAWAAGLVALLTGPYIAMAYLNRGWWALIYLGAYIAVIAIALVVEPVGPLNQNAMTVYIIGSLAIYLIGLAHSIVAALRRDTAERMKWYSRWPAVVAFIAAPVALSLAVRTWFYQAFWSPSVSMSPTLNLGDNFFVSKRSYDAAPPQRGDVIVLRAYNGVRYVKRIVGLPGDRVRMIGGRLHLNGTAVGLEAIGPPPPGDYGSGRSVTEQRETLPGGRSYRVLDLGAFGFDDTDTFIVPADSYFVLGDNRDNSDDSRGHLGMVKRDDIIGRATIIYWDGATQSFTNRAVQ